MKLSSFLLPTILITSALAIWSCSKSNSGKPKISIESIDTEIPNGGSMTANIKFSSGSKLANGNFLAIKTRINQKLPQNTLEGTDTLLVSIPEFSAEKGELTFTMPYQSYLHYDDTDNDTLVFKFAVLDVDGKSSDTVTSPKVVVQHP